jgi:hypothetical protein
LRIIALREVGCTVYKAGIREARSTYKILVGRPGAKHPLGRPKSREWNKDVDPYCEYRFQ